MPVAVGDEAAALALAEPADGPTGEASQGVPIAAYSFSLQFERARLNKTSASGAMPTSHSAVSRGSSHSDHRDVAIALALEAEVGQTLTMRTSSRASSSWRSRSRRPSSRRS